MCIHLFLNSSLINIQCYISQVYNIVIQQFYTLLSDHYAMCTFNSFHLFHPFHTHLPSGNHQSVFNI